MGRTLIYLSILVLAVFVLAAALLLQTGGESLSSPAAVPVSVHDLSVAPQAHDDERVVTTGVLLLVHEPNDHFSLGWIRQFIPPWQQSAPPP